MSTRRRKSSSVRASELARRLAKISDGVHTSTESSTATMQPYILKHAHETHTETFWLRWKNSTETTKYGFVLCPCGHSCMNLLAQWIKKLQGSVSAHNTNHLPHSRKRWCHPHTHARTHAHVTISCECLQQRWQVWLALMPQVQIISMANKPTFPPLKKHFPGLSHSA